MNNKIACLALAVALIVLATITARPANHMQIAAKETAFERIMRTGTIRCGYYVSDGWTMRDPNTGVMSGPIADYMEALGDVLKLKIVWQEELNLATYLQDLQNGRYDLECSGGWPNALRGKQVEYTTPIYFLPMYGVARVDDHRFDHRYEAVNDPAVTIAGHDGASDALIRIKRFPKAKADDLPGNAGQADTYLEVVNKKADLYFDDVVSIRAFDKSNPGKIRIVDGEPLRLIPANASFAAGEYRLQQMLNTATNELLYDGVIDRILDTYDPDHAQFLRVAAPYINPQTQK